MACLFYIEDFDCETTASEKCLEKLAIRIRSANTPEAEKAHFDTCAERIYKKDPYRGAEAQALLHQEKEITPSDEEEIRFFGEHLHSCDFDTWKFFIQENREHINFFRLCRFLKERWSRLESKEKIENIPPVEQVINLIKNTYPKKKDILQQSLRIVTSDIKTIRVRSREEDTKKELKAHKRAKRWEDLNNYISNINTAGFSQALIRLLNEEQRHADEGVLWLNKKQKLVELVEKSAEQDLDLDSFYQEFMEFKEEILDLLENQSDFGDPGSIKEIQQVPGQFYGNILTGIKNSKRSPDARFRQLKLWENALQIFKYPEPNAWEEYSRELNVDMVKVYSDNILETLNTAEDIKEIKGIIDKAIKEADQFNLREKIEDYINGGKVIDIFGIQQNIDELVELDRSLERLTTVSDPFAVTFTLNKRPDDFELISDLSHHREIFRELTQKYQAIEEMIRFTRDTTEQLKHVMARMEKESKNILFNRPRIKIERFEREVKAIEDKTDQVIKESQTPYKFKFLENLKRITQMVNQLLFPVKPLKKSTLLSHQDELSQNEFIKSLIESLSAGEAFYRNLKQLGTKIKSASMGDPIAVQDEFFEIISLYKNKIFVFSKPGKEEICKLYESLMDMIHTKIHDYLKTVKTRLNFPFPLIEKDLLGELQEKTGKLLKQLDKIDRSYPGFEEFVDAYKDELEEWNCVINVHEAVWQEKFDAAAARIKEGIFDPDISYPAQILVYYYRYLHQSTGDENEWLNFFSRFSMDSIKMNESGYQVILKHYRKDIRKNFRHLALSSIESHFKVFKTLYPNDELLPYFVYLCGQSSPKEFFKAVGHGTFLTGIFKSMVSMLEKNEDWKRYMALYNQSPKNYKHYFEKPVDKVLKKLDMYHKELVEKFETGDIKAADIDAYIDRIPENQDFSSYIEKSKRLKDLWDSYREIKSRFKSLEEEDIWIENKFLHRLFQSLGRRIDKFTEEFTNTRNTHKWVERIESLKTIYDLGRKLIGQLDKMLQRDLNYKAKHEENYSNELKRDIQELLSLWGKFNKEIDRLTGNRVFKDSFQYHHIKGFTAKWQKMSLYPLCVKEKIGTAQQLMDDYFEMWKQILENHNQFLTYYKRKAGLQEEDLDKIKVLDEFIRLTIERLKQQGKL